MSCIFFISVFTYSENGTEHFGEETKSIPSPVWAYILWECNGNVMSYKRLVFMDSWGPGVGLLWHYSGEAQISDCYVLLLFLGHWPQLEAIHGTGWLFGLPIMVPFMFICLLQIDIVNTRDPVRRPQYYNRTAVKITDIIWKILWGLF